MKTDGALAGVNVLDLSRLLPGPYCSMILADHGARVIAVEDPRYRSEGLFTPVYRNKQHMTLNLKTEAGLAAFFRLARWADVLLEGFRPGVTARLGVDYAAVRALNPGIVYCSITGYGQSGRLRERVGHDVNYLAQSGVLDLIGPAEGPPSIPGVQIADIAGGGMNAAIGVLMALFARTRSGEGQYIDISMTDGLLGLLPVALFLREAGGTAPRRSDSLLSHRYACYNTYATADGRSLSIGAVENRFWQRLCAHFGVPEYGPLQYDEARRAEILDFMHARFRSRALAEWEAELGPLEVCYGAVRGLEEVLAEPLFREREALVEMQAADGALQTALGVPVRMSASPGSVRTPPPAFGQDTGAVLAEFGYSSGQIERFAEDGVT
jgi:crotonobetainyl-CoA:carnitine CoA-transferase CaiB-like acyl-CoA transferase